LGGKVELPAAISKVVAGAGPHQAKRSEPGSFRLGGDPADMAVVELMSELDHLQPERPWAHDPRGEQDKRLYDDRPGVDYLGQPYYPRSHLM
jgi:hypothetical protein